MIFWVEKFMVFWVQGFGSRIGGPREEVLDWFWDSGPTLGVEGLGHVRCKT